MQLDRRRHRVLGDVVHDDPLDGVAGVDGAAGEGALSPRAARAVMALVGADSAAEARREAAAQLDALTDREREIALAATEGLSNAAIAAIPTNSQPSPSRITADRPTLLVSARSA